MGLCTAALQAWRLGVWRRDAASKLGCERGYTLFQVIIGLQIFAIVSAVGVSQMSNYGMRFKMMAAGNQLGFEIARARMQAIGQNRYSRILMLSATQYSRESSNDQTNWTNKVTTTLPSGVTATTTSAEVRFDRKGTATKYDSISLNAAYSKSQSGTRTITTNPLGQVTVSDG
jgi:Tfp pilus assembly protein FimT